MERSVRPSAGLAGGRTITGKHPRRAGRSRPVRPQRTALFARANSLALRDGHHGTRWQFRDPAGKLLSAEVELTALPSLGPDAYSVHIRNVSTVVETRAERAACEARFRDLFEVATDAFGFASVAGETPAFIDCNASLARVHGATDKSQVIGKTPPAIMAFQTIAEFIEDTATLELLRTIGVNYGRGFLLGQPAPIDSPASPAITLSC